MVEDVADLLKDGQEVHILIHAGNETPLTLEMPPFVELMVTYTEPGMRGDTATNASKPATLETGAVIQVPLFIEQELKSKWIPATAATWNGLNSIL